MAKLSSTACARSVNPADLPEPVETEEGETEGGFNEAIHLTLQDAQKIEADIQMGGEIKDVLPPIDFGRVAAQTAKQVVLLKVRDAEREKQFEEFKDKVGEIISGIVKRVEIRQCDCGFRPHGSHDPPRPVDST